MALEKVSQLYEGKAKIIYATKDPDKVIMYFKDDATAFNAKKKGTIREKGVFNCAISTRILKHLEEKGIPTHYLDTLSDREMLCRKVDIVPLEVVMRNVVAGSLSKRFGIEEGRPLSRPVLEFYYKSDPLDDPLITTSHIKAFNFATDEDVAEISAMAEKVNALLKAFFDRRDIVLVDFKLEFGRQHGRIYLADEITPDGCRLWEKMTARKLDKDRFRRDMGGIEEAYAEVHEKVLREMDGDR